MISLARDCSTSCRMSLALDLRHGFGRDAGRADVGDVGASLHEVVGQVHHLAEAVVHDREAAVGAKHRQAVRHVVERRVELAGKRRLALARDQGADENRLQAGRDVLQREEEQDVEQRHADIEGAAVGGQRKRQRSAGQQHLHMEYPWPAIGSAAAGSHVAERDRGRDHVGDGIVAAHHRDQAPRSEGRGIEHRTELVTHFPARNAIGRQAGTNFLILTRVERAQRAGNDKHRDARPQKRVAGLQRRHERGDGGAQRPRKHRTRVGEQRIDQRRVNRRRHLPIGLSALIGELHIGGTRSC